MPLVTGSQKTKHIEYVQGSDPDLPSYICDEYRRWYPYLELVRDMYHGRSRWYLPGAPNSSYGIVNPVLAERYLPQEPDETPYDWSMRLNRAYFDRRFRVIIESFAAFLSRIVLGDQLDEEKFLNYCRNIDLKGSSLEVFFRAADESALRDEHCFVFIDYPKVKQADNYAEERDLRASLRPYLILVDRRAVINWEVDPFTGWVRHMTIQEFIDEKVGKFGTESRIQYRVLTPGRFEIYREDPNNGEIFLYDEGETNLDFIPVVPYGIIPNDSEPFSGEPPLYDLAEANLELYQKNSDLSEILRKSNIPVLTIQEHDTRPRLGADDEEDEDKPITRRTCIRNATANYAEPSGTAIDKTEAHLERLRSRMDARAMLFLGLGKFTRTATEIEAMAAPVTANLSSMASAKAAAIRKIVKYWMAYYGNPPKDIPEGAVNVDDRLIQSEISTDKARYLLELQEKGGITKHTLLDLLRQGKLLPVTFDPDKEISIMDVEAAIQQQAALEAAAAKAQLQAAAKPTNGSKPTIR